MLVGHKINYGVFRIGIYLRCVCILETEYVSREFDNCYLKSEANAEIRNLVFARIFCCGDLSLYSACAETAGDKYAVGIFKTFRNIFFGY